VNDKLNKTQRILRSSKVKTDERGRTVWVDDIATTRLELMSTQMLRQVIETENSDTNDHLREVASGKDGLLARDVDKGRFEIISDEELQHILDGTDVKSDDENADKIVNEPMVEAVSDEDELELVSTQMLRVMISPEDENPLAAEESDGGGFNPYDHS